MSSFRRKFNIIRTIGTGHYDDTGAWVDDTNKETLAIRASVQPLNNNETQALAEGGRTGRTVKIYTSTKLLPKRQAHTNAAGNELPQQEADVLLYDGEKWQIVMVNAYQSGVINHYKCYAQEVTDGN